MVNFKKLLTKKRIAVICLLLALILVWFSPIKSKNVSVQFLTDGSYIADSVSIGVFSQKAHKDLYINDYQMTDNYVLLNIPTEYNSDTKISVKDQNFAKSVKEIKVLSNGLRQADYVSASLDSELWVEDGENIALSSKALDTIEKGRNNPWMMRLIFSFCLIAIALFYLFFKVIKKHFGNFKAVLVSIVALCAPLSIYLFQQQQLFDKTVFIFGMGFSNFYFVAAIIASVALLITACILFDKENKASKIVIIAVYVFATLFSIGKMAFYNERVAYFPDESAHISYVAYLDKTNDFIPEYEEVPMSYPIHEYTETATTAFANGTVNNLRHPPLYYHLLRLSNAIEFKDENTYTVDLDKIRFFSMAIGLSALILIFYIGYSRLKKIPIIHLLYSTIVISVPMMCYGLAGVNNDTLCLFTVTLTVLGLLRYVENKRNFLTYFIIALGVTSTVLTKMTAGIVAVIAAIGVLVIFMIKEKSWRGIFNWRFLITLPIYVTALAFYMLMIFKYGSLQPSLHVLSEEYAYSTGFYLPVEQRTVQSLWQYLTYFVGMFFKTWSGVASGISLLKGSFFEGMAFTLIWFIPLLLLLKSSKKTAYKYPILTTYIGLFAAFALQLVNGYNGLLTRGYLGGFQSRYYLCAILIFAFAAAVLLQKFLAQKVENNTTNKKVAICVSVIFVGLLTYGDFVYFLLNYNSYIG